MTEQQITITHNKYLDSKVKITEMAGGIKNPTFKYLKLLLTEKGYTINEKTFAENFHLLTRDGVFNKMSDLLADRNEVSIVPTLSTQPEHLLGAESASTRRFSTATPSARFGSTLVFTTIGLMAHHLQYIFSPTGLR